jgi:quinol-cytochrome oxidoreductase complex cytochrome b subunit
MSDARAAHHPADDETVPFFPVQLMREAKMAVALTVIVVLVGALWRFFGLELGPPADPMVTPPHTKPEWYFLALYQVLKFVPKTAGAVIPVVLVAALFLLPFVDRTAETSKRQTRIRFALTVVVGVLVVVMTIWGGM